MVTKLMNQKTTAIGVVLALVLAHTWACAPKRPSNNSDPSNAPIAGYISLQEDMADLDTSPLVGRTIVLDPGHGGYFRGAIGPGNQHEADANLGVSLYLRGLLEWAGATVFMTRTSDHDFLSPADSTLTSDLAFRVSFTDSLQPDVFVSLHHNSTASADPTINETQTYYPLGAGGAALDLARAIHRHLVMNLNISPAQIMPGNFHVLRHATVPAVLGEPAMISNPVMADRLSQAANLKLEAEAYFLGILDYFSGGTPIFSPAIVQDDRYTVRGDTIFCPSDSPSLVIQWNFEPGITGPGPNPMSFQLLDGETESPFSVSANGATVTWSGFPPSSGSLNLQLRGQNLAGRSSPTRTTTIRSSDAGNPLREIIPENPDNPLPRLSLLHWQSMDPQSPPNQHQGDGFSAAMEGWSLIPSMAGETDPALPSGLQWHLFSYVSTAPISGISWQERLPLNSNAYPLMVRDHNIPAVPLPIIGAEAPPVWIDLPGFLPLVDPNPSRSSLARTVSASGRHWPLQPLVPQLRGKSIVIDPAGGSTTNQGQGPLGTRGSDLNLETAQHLKNLLEGAGARVVLTRLAEDATRQENKVKLANDTGADFFLTIARTPNAEPSVSIQHHPQSKRGKEWATSIGKMLNPLLDSAEMLSVGPDWGYLLRHTACPAVAASFPLPLTNAQENKRRSPAWAQAEARALFSALIEQVLPPDSSLDCFFPERVIPSLPEPAFGLQDIRWVLVDGNFPWYPVTPSVFNSSPNPVQSVDSWTSPGLPNLSSVHTLELHTSNGWQLWLWQSDTPPFAANLLLEGK